MRNCKVSSSWNVFTWKLSIRRCLQGFWRAYSSIVSCRRIWDGRSFLVDQTHLFWSIIIHSTAGVHSIAQDITGIFYRSTFGLIWVSTFKQARSKAPEVRISTTRCQMHGRPTLKRITLLTTPSIFQNLSPIYIPPTQWLTFLVCMCSAVLTSISHAHWCGKRENCGCLRMGGLVPPERSTGASLYMNMVTFIPTTYTRFTRFGRCHGSIILPFETEWRGRPVPMACIPIPVSSLFAI